MGVRLAADSLFHHRARPRGKACCSGEQDSAFSLDQDSSKDHLRLIINSGRSDFLLKDFAPYLPALRLPRSDLPKAESDASPNWRQPRGSETNRTSSGEVPRR
jgi:hypothetical protein